MLENIVNNDEFLYRGVVNNNWDFENDRPSSATFKDSKGVSVDRDDYRNEAHCINFLLDKKNFFAICKVLTENVREQNALVLYIPASDNIYHSEIHDSLERIQLRGKKPHRIREKSSVVYRK